MAFTYYLDETTIVGNKRKARGRFVSAGGSTGGDIVTGLKRVTGFNTTHTAAAVVADSPVANETFTATGYNGGTVTIVTTANASGIWEAEGYI